jgi:hypothetical protein
MQPLNINYGNYVATQELLIIVLNEKQKDTNLCLHCTPNVKLNLKGKEKLPIEPNYLFTNPLTHKRDLLTGHQRIYLNCDISLNFFLLSLVLFPLCDK